MASPNLSEIVTTTLRNRSRQLADNLSNHNALLQRMREQGNQTTVTGRDIVRELEYAANSTVQFYQGYETLNVEPSDVLSAAVFDYKQMAGNVTISGLEQIKNSGVQAIINLLEARINVLEKSMMNTLATSLYSDGTGTDGKEIGGLQLIVADGGTGTVGGRLVAYCSAEGPSAGTTRCKKLRSDDASCSRAVSAPVSCASPVATPSVAAMGADRGRSTNVLLRTTRLPVFFGLL